MIIKLKNGVKIGTHTFKIKLDPHIHGDDKDYGQINYRTETIKIWKDAPLSIKNEALHHEIIHLSQHIYRVDISDQDIDRVAETFSEFLFNNLGIEYDWSDIPDIGT